MKRLNVLYKKPVSILVNGKIIVRGLISKNAIVWNKHEIFFYQ